MGKILQVKLELQYFSDNAKDFLLDAIFNTYRFGPSSQGILVGRLEPRPALRCCHHQVT